MISRVRISLIILAAIAFASFLVWLGLSMGFFNKLFGKKGNTGNTATSPITGHREDWAAYLSTIDNDKVGSILVDLGLKALAPVSSKPRRLRVDVAMNYPSENGLPTQSEFGSLNQIDEKLGDTLKSLGAVYAGHLYCQGTMSLYYYLGEDAAFETALSGAMAVFPSYKYEYKLDKEPNWESYAEVLYPLPIQMQSIHNQKVIDNLRNNGDKLDVKRPVDRMHVGDADPR